MSETKPLNCPFCGGEAFIRQNNDAMKTYSAYCGNEDCSVSPKVSAYGKEMVIRLWNTRKPMERIMEKLDEIYDFYDIKKKEAYYEKDWEDFDRYTCVNRGIYEAITIVKKKEGGIE